MGHVNVMGAWCMVHGPKSEVDCSFNFGAPCFFTLQSSTRGTPVVVAPALEFALNVRILSHHHGNINSHPLRRCGSNDGGWMDPFLLFAFHFFLVISTFFHLFAINYVWTCQFMDAIFM